MLTQLSRRALGLAMQIGALGAALVMLGVIVVARPRSSCGCDRGDGLVDLSSLGIGFLVALVRIVPAVRIGGFIAGRRADDRWSVVTYAALSLLLALLWEHALRAVAPPVPAIAALSSMLWPALVIREVRRARAPTHPLPRVTVRG